MIIGPSIIIAEKAKVHNGSWEAEIHSSGTFLFTFWLRTASHLGSGIYPTNLEGCERDKIAYW